MGGGDGLGEWPSGGGVPSVNPKLYILSNI
jgi:hypothetical protein